MSEFVNDGATNYEIDEKIHTENNDDTVPRPLRSICTTDIEPYEGSYKGPMVIKSDGKRVYEAPLYESPIDIQSESLHQERIRRMNVNSITVKTVAGAIDPISENFYKDKKIWEEIQRGLYNARIEALKIAKDLVLGINHFDHRYDGGPDSPEFMNDLNLIYKIADLNLKYIMGESNGNDTKKI